MAPADPKTNFDPKLNENKPEFGRSIFLCPSLVGGVYFELEYHEPRNSTDKSSRPGRCGIFLKEGNCVRSTIREPFSPEDQNHVNS